MAAGMNAPLYTTEILRLAASLPAPEALARVDGSASRRSPTCGSVISTRVMVGPDGRIIALSQEVSACAFGQAAASLVAAGADGRDRAAVSAAAAALNDWLNGRRDDPGDWPGLAALAPARSRKSRHGAIALAFDALAAALDDAEARRR
jgi:NifU-like protein involved in Fe-S cluster formation